MIHKTTLPTFLTPTAAANLMMAPRLSGPLMLSQTRVIGSGEVAVICSREDLGIAAMMPGEVVRSVHNLMLVYGRW